MRILISPQSDTMLLDSLTGMNGTFDQLQAFLEGSDTDIEFPAKMSGPLEADEGWLRGLRVRKGEGPIRLVRGPDQFLELSGSLANLARYIRHFSFDENEEGTHHHPEHEYDAAGPLPGYMSPDSEWLIVEVDSDYVAELEDES